MSSRSEQPGVPALRLDPPPVVEGPVERGRQLGRTLGFPTANVAITPDSGLAFGVYAARSVLADGRRIDGVASVGVSPTIDGRTAPRLEVWLFDFDEDLYGRPLRTALLAFLRPEVKFPDLDALTRQVMADADQARQALAQFRLDDLAGQRLAGTA